MTKIITICDYGVGNLLSVERAFIQCGAQVVRTDDADKIAAADSLVLPGVGAFGHCAQEIRSRGIWQAIAQFAASGKPMLGICVGMQLLYEESFEFGTHRGFGLTAGSVDKIPAVADANYTGDNAHKIPFIGWAKLIPTGHDNPLFRGINQELFVYFVHSFFGAKNADCAAYYRLSGHEITAMIQRDNITACQFHPEKSGAVGLQILNNWIH